MELFSKRIAWLAVIGAVAVVLIQFWVRPPWRDEYWALFFAAPSMDLGAAVSGRMTADVHPPLYFMTLHVWLQIIDHELFARGLNLILIAVAFALGWAWRGKQRQQTIVYLFLCATSFWLVFFAAEIRMMAALFLACMLSVLAARNATERPAERYRWLAAFAGVGLLAASMHFFGALWIGAFGLCLGLSFLMQRKAASFIATGLSTLVALLPVLFWIALVRPDQNSGAPDVMPPPLENLTKGLEQYLRGIIVKTFIANWPAWIAGILGLSALFKAGPARFEKTVLAGVALSTLIAFSIHLGLVSMIKERAFIVIIPGIFYLLASGLVSIRPDQGKAKRMAGWVPIMALVAFPLFSTEYFKDREEYHRVADYISGFEACRDAPILMYERPSGQGEAYSAFYARSVTRYAFDGAGLDLEPLTEAGMNRARQSWASSTCPVRAIGLVLPRGNGRRHREMREEMQALGLPLDQWHEERFGEGRSIVFMDGPSAS